MCKIILQRITFICCLSLLFASYKTLAQSNKPSSYFPNIIPPPPNSASLGLYGQVPLNQFTGNANVSIPLLEFKSNSLSLPISLSYSSDGIKVDQYESNVGMGWALNAGGVITRQVFDYMDNYNGRMQKPNTPINSSEMEIFLEQASLAPQVDTQPDIFTYNVNGLCGKFFLDETNNPVEIEPSGLRIEITENFLDLGFALNNAPEVIITDTKGVKYYFGGLNAIESTSIRKIFSSSPEPPSDPVKTSWYLTKIEDPSTNSQILLSYDSRIVNYTTGNEQNLEYVYGFAGSRLSSGLFNYQYTSRSSESLLKEINTTNGKVSFGYSKRFADSNFPLSKVDEVSYTTINGSVIKRIKLDYDQYTGNSFPNSYNQSDDYFKKRFFLKQINEISAESNPITHQFEYYFPEKLPARFSFAQDNYGVFNGKNNSSLISDEISIFSSVINSSFTDAKLANRRPDKNFGYYGLLKKIIYPTKGDATFTYEPHVLGKENIPVLPVKTAFGINVATHSELIKNSNTATIHSAIEQTIRVTGTVVNNIDQCSETENPFSLQADIEIIDLSTNLHVKFWTVNSNADAPVLIGDYYTLYNKPSPNEDVFTLQADKDYLIKISINRPCIFGGIFFNYYNLPVTYQEIEKQIGGFRIQSVIKNSDAGESKETEKYFYRPYNCPTCQSGSYINQAAIAYVKKIERNNLCEYPSDRILYSVGSSNLARVYSSQNAQFGYGYVTKSYGENFENGGEEFKYDIIQDGLPLPTLGSMDKTTPFTNAFGSGRLLSHKIFNKNLTVVKENSNIYYHDISKDKSVKCFNAFMSTLAYAKIGDVTGISCALELNWSQYTLNEYSIRSQWHYLSESHEIQYDINGLNPITTITNFNYNNPNHLQLTSQTTTNSKQESLETKYFYAKDPQMAGKPFVSELINKNMIGIPLDTQSYKSGTKLSEQLTVYDKSAATNNLLLPKSIYAAKFPNDIIAFPNIGNLEKKITFDQYDDKGNILQYTQESGIPVAIIWGYNKTQPIAKIENAAYNQVSSYVDNLQNMSNADTDNCLTSSCKEQILREALNAMRVSLPQFMITTYTYNPLVGITSTTDPKGITSYYEYDHFNRLKFVKDMDLNVLQKYCYNYKGQQIDCADNSSSTVIVYKSTARNGSFTKNNCSSGGVPESVAFSQVQGAVTSTISQADADSLGLAKFNTDGQSNANTVGKCFYYSVARSGSFTKNCDSGGIGSTVGYSQGAGVLISNVSQSEADAQGVALFNFNGQANANSVGYCTYYSVARNGSFTKNNCGAGGFGSIVSYSQPAGASSSNVSQAEADAQGLALFNTNGQANANSSGYCTYYSVARNGTFTKNNCGTGGIGSIVNYNQPAGALLSNVSQAEVDAQGLALFNSNGQAYANASGYCTYLSSARNGSFSKNNCTSGGVGSIVGYNQYQGAQTSDVSQADADSKGLALFNSNGQNNANTNGICTFYNVLKTATFTKNNCALGLEPVGPTSYTIPAGTFNSNISQADADSKAQNLITTNGQSYANTNGSCKAIVFTATGEQLYDAGRMFITTTASSPNHNGYTFNIRITYDTPQGTYKTITTTITLGAGVTSRVSSIAVPAQTTATIRY